MIKLKQTPEQLELIKALGSKDKTIAAEASQAFAAFLAPVIQKVIDQIGTASLIYSDLSYNEDDSPSFPLDLYYDKTVGYIQTWSQHIAGGLPTNEVSGGKELKIATYNLQTAVSFLKKYARRGRFDVLNAAINRMAQEMLVKQELNAWSVLMRALAESNTAGAGTGNATADHVIGANAATVFQVEDVNQLMILYRKIHRSFAAGTSAAVNGGKITDLFISPTTMGQVRAFAYQPMNTRAVPNTDESTALGLPDAVREQIYRAAGQNEIFGVLLTELMELGVNEKYATLFDTFYSNSTPSFDGTTQELAVACDLGSENAFIRAIEQLEGGGTFTVQPDDQFVTREDKSGFYGSLNEGRVVIDSRKILGLII